MHIKTVTIIIEAVILRWVPSKPPHTQKEVATVEGMISPNKKFEIFCDGMTATFRDEGGFSWSCQVNESFCDCSEFECFKALWRLDDCGISSAVTVIVGLLPPPFMATHRSE